MARAGGRRPRGRRRRSSSLGSLVAADDVAGGRTTSSRPAASFVAIGGRAHSQRTASSRLVASFLIAGGRAHSQQTASSRRSERAEGVLVADGVVPHKLVAGLNRSGWCTYSAVGGRTDSSRSGSLCGPSDGAEGVEEFALNRRRREECETETEGEPRASCLGGGRRTGLG